MGLFDIDIFKTLKARMQYHTARQKVLAENVANSDVPGFKARDLKKFESYLGTNAGESHLKMASSGGSSLMVTNTKHIASSHTVSGFEAKGMDGYEVTPSNNNSTLEEQMMLLAENQMDHKAAITLYEKSMSLLKTAIRRG